MSGCNTLMRFAKRGLTATLTSALALTLCACQPPTSTAPANANPTSNKDTELAASTTPTTTETQPQEEGFSFAAIGDSPYTALDESTLREVLNEIATTNVQFIVHVGDIKSSSEPCSDQLLHHRIDLINQSGLPVVLLPGDNEWVDCQRDRATGFDRRERLNRLREWVHDKPHTLGQETMPVLRMSSLSAYRPYAENMRWDVQGIVFVSLNIPGSNNNWRREAGRNGEFDERLLANQLWLRKAVEHAQMTQAKGLVIVFHANPNFHDPTRAIMSRLSGDRDGYQELKAQLQQIAANFPEPILIIHGDTHQFRIDHPVRDAKGQIASHLTRLEVFGYPFSDAWVRVTVHPNGPERFTLNPVRLIRNE